MNECYPYKIYIYLLWILLMSFSFCSWLVLWDSPIDWYFTPPPAQLITLPTYFPLYVFQSFFWLSFFPSFKRLSSAQGLPQTDRFLNGWWSDLKRHRCGQLSWRSLMRAACVPHRVSEDRGSADEAVGLPPGKDHTCVEVIRWRFAESRFDYRARRRGVWLAVECRQCD